VGSLYLAGVALMPEILRAQLAIPFYFGGTSVLIVVVVAMDTMNQVQSHLLAHQYEGLLEKSRLRGKGARRRHRRPRAGAAAARRARVRRCAENRIAPRPLSRAGSRRFPTRSRGVPMPLDLGRKSA
jgi:hypothetical protein